MQLRDIASQIGKFWSGLGTAKKITLIVLVLGTAASLLFLMSWTGKYDYRHLYANLAAEDAGEILTYLKNQKIPYRVSSNGTAIMVPADRVHECRLDLASQGLPQGGGIGFEVFDNTKLGMTEFVQNVNYQRALQGELSRTINNIAEVESSRVHIVMPEKSLFVEAEEPATASVVLKLRRGRWMSQEQVQGIVHLVSSSVARLKPENVTVVDSTGKMLAGYGDPSSPIRMSGEQLEYQETLERKLENRVKTMLDKALGTDNAVVRLSCAIDFKRYEMTEERYYPDNRVVRSEQHLNESSTEMDPVSAGIPGLRTNIDKRQEAQTEQDKTRFEKQDRTVNYEIGKLTSHTVEPTASVKQISVAVVVDGTYRQVDDGKGSISWQYIPRKAEELAQIKSIVQGAINYNADRGDTVEIANIPFETDKLAGPVEPVPPAGWFERVRQYDETLKYIFFTSFLLFSFLFVVRPIIKWLTASTLNDAEFMRQLPMTVGEIEKEYKGSLNMPNRDELNQLLTADGDLTADVMRDWIKER